MLEFRKRFPKVQFEIVLDFAKESDTITIEGYFMKPHEIISYQNIPLYVIKRESEIVIYSLTKSSSDWVRFNLDYNIDDDRVDIPFEFMYQFDLVRIIPENGLKYLNSYLRVIKKTSNQVKFYPIEEEIGNEVKI